MFDKLERLIPVDQHIKNLQRNIDNIWWENPDNDDIDLEYMESRLKYFLSLKDSGIGYEPTF
jgi:hypothetical protein